MKGGCIILVSWLPIVYNYWLLLWLIIFSTIILIGFIAIWVTKDYLTDKNKYAQDLYYDDGKNEDD